MLLAGDGGDRRAEDAYACAAVCGVGMRRDESPGAPVGAPVAVEVAALLALGLRLRFRGAVMASYMLVRGAKTQRSSMPTRKKGSSVSASVLKAAEIVKRRYMGGTGGGRGIVPAIVGVCVLEVLDVGVRRWSERDGDSQMGCGWGCKVLVV
jgi:hypothetical protein